VKLSVPLGWARRRAFAELLIDREEDRSLWAVLVAMLRERQQRPPGTAYR
jgi:hypothetical protein